MFSSYRNLVIVTLEGKCRCQHVSVPAMQDRTLWQDTPNMLVLVLLYMMQGVPLGLTMGAM